MKEALRRFGPSLGLAAARRLLFPGSFNGEHDKFAASRLEEFGVCAFFGTPGVMDCGSGIAACSGAGFAGPGQW